MKLAIDTLSKLLIEKEGWLDEMDENDYDESSFSIINENINGLKEAIAILEINYRKKLIFTPQKQKDLRKIRTYVCNLRQIRPASLNNKNKDRYIAESRQLMFRVYYELFIENYYSANECFADIGNFFDRDRNTVRHGVNVTRDIPKLNNLALQYIKQIEHKLK